MSILHSLFSSSLPLSKESISNLTRDHTYRSTHEPTSLIGVGDTITGATGSLGKPLGDGLNNAATGLENGTRKVAQGVEDAGEWKSGAKRI